MLIRRSFSPSGGGGGSVTPLPLVLIDNIEYGAGGNGSTYEFTDIDYTSLDLYYTNQTLTNANRNDSLGVTRFGPQAYPGAPGGTTDWNLHRMIQGDKNGNTSDGFRCECNAHALEILTYDGTPATDYWMAFGTYMAQSEFPLAADLLANDGDATDRFSIFQMHQHADADPDGGGPLQADDGSSGPTFSFECRPEVSQNPSTWGQGAKYFVISRNATGLYQPVNNEVYHTGGDILFDAPWGHIVHLRKHWNSAAGPMLEIWEQRGLSAAWVKILTYTGAIGFENNDDTDWWKWGPYWWSMAGVTQYTDRRWWTKRLRAATAANGGSLAAAQACYP